MSKTIASIALTSVLAVALPSIAHGAQCTARSPTITVALVELYTSQGCSSCPPADEWLSRLRKSQPNAAVLPLSMHVNYWDYIGWKDPYAQQKFTDRQHSLTRQQGLRSSYTPQVVLSAGDYRDWWDEKAFAQDVAKINRQPAAALIDIEAIEGTVAGQVKVSGKAKTAVTEPADLYLAVFENSIVNKVARGENAGSTLKHEHVVRNWLGPFPIKDGQASIEDSVKVLATKQPASLGLAAFVQTKSGKVLQAVGCDLR